jgi:hypothetical protein
MNEREPFFISTYAQTLAELKALPIETQSLLLLKRLRKLNWDFKVQPKRFSKRNFLNTFAGRPDPESLATGFPAGETIRLLQQGKRTQDISRGLK